MNDICKNHVDNCRFCWMCRHICPIGNATGLERNTSRARALGLSLVNRDALKLADVVDNLYECACCGACTKECVTGWDPVMFTKAARLDAALEGVLPTYITKLVENCLATGNAYGVTALDGALAAAVAKHSAKTDVLFFLGVDARCKAPESAVKAIAAMEKTGVAFTVLADELPSGQHLEYLIGAADETKKQMSAAAKQLDAFKTVVAYDPADALIFKRRLGELDIKTAAKVETFTAFLAANLAALGAKKSAKKMVVHDAFQLSRDLGENDPFRAIVAAYGEQEEMLLNRKDTMWAGNLLMAEWMPDVMAKVAADRIQNVRGVKADTVVCASVSEYVNLKKAAPADITVLSVEELILG